ncbi:MAG: 16S rRNA (uracil(1498)-N(3))-methyltransferase, partial [Planctomycetes bacterium]|nr:16S rRNA (uracil(1498)-N(3))-methyltransferase [Planctomycetota bacterium]
HHLATVLRLGVGELITLADGRGSAARATLTVAARRRVEVEVDAADFRPRPGRAVHVAFAAPRHNRAEWLFEHGTEVGIAVFWPMRTERTRPHGDRSERWQKIVLAAAGQCDRDWLPEIRPALELAEFLRQPDLPSARYLGAAEGGPPRQSHGDAVLLVGPEGGFTDAEEAAILASGFERVCFGPHVLRTETAALVGAAVLMQP